MYMENISKNITYGEAINSPTAKAKGISNVPTEEHLKNMKHWATQIFEKVRAGLGNKSIKVSSFYRSPKLNSAVGGSPTSQHANGEAGDIDGDVYGNPNNKQVFEYIRDHCEFDQLIVEGIVGGTIAWVHSSIKRGGGNRKQILFMYYSLKGQPVAQGTKGAKKIYEQYTLKRYKEIVK